MPTGSCSAICGHTAFTETADVEEVLVSYASTMAHWGHWSDSQFQGTLDQFSGDGIVVFFNDPVLCPDPEGDMR